MRLRILIVEDDALIATSLEDILVRAGHEVVGTAIHMHGALRAADGAYADVAIMDVDLAAGTNGVETAKLLRERHDVPSLFVSARADDELRAMASEWRPVGFVGKPFGDAQILGALERMCEARATRQFRESSSSPRSSKSTPSGS